VTLPRRGEQIGCYLLRCVGRYWHLADIPAAPANVRYWTNSGHGSVPQYAHQQLAAIQGPMVV